MKETIWEVTSSRGIDMLGYIPQIILASDERPVVEQVNDRYAHGSGWNRFTGFKLNRKDMSIEYPGDPVFQPIARAKISEKETVYVYPYAWVLIDRGGDDWEIARMD